MPKPQTQKSALTDAKHRRQQGDWLGALDVLEQARKAEPGNAAILLEIAHIAGRLGMHDGAENCLRDAITVEPDNIEVAVALGTHLAKTNKSQEALELLQERTLSHPSEAALWVALGGALRMVGRSDEAEEFYTEALRLKPRSIAARAGLADIWFDRGETNNAIKAYDQALKNAPKNAQLRLNRALASLHHGDTKSGWRDYEWRLKIDGQCVERRFQGGRSPRLWDGSPLRGRSLVLCAEQGLGDQIFFSSCVAAAQKLAGDGQIYLDCDPRLVALFQRSFPDCVVRAFEPKSENGRVFADYTWVGEPITDLAMLPIGSLPGLFERKGAKANHGTLVADAGIANTWKACLANLARGLKIGICWRSGKTSGLRNAQYAPLADWADFIAATEAQFVNVQYDTTAGEVAELAKAANRPIFDPPDIDQRNDIDKLAALLSQLDIVVSAPTAVAALSSAMGTPTLKITAAGSWTGLGQEIEPFRPAARIIKPSEPQNWLDALQTAREFALLEARRAS